MNDKKSELITIFFFIFSKIIVKNTSSFLITSIDDLICIKLPLKHVTLQTLM